MNMNVFRMNDVKVTMNVITRMAMTNAIVDEHGDMPNVALHPLMGVLPAVVVPTAHGNLYIGYLVQLDTSNKLLYNRLAINNTDFYATYNTALLYGGGDSYDTIAVSGNVADAVAATVNNSNLRVRLLVV